MKYKKKKKATRIVVIVVSMMKLTDSNLTLNSRRRSDDYIFISSLQLFVWWLFLPEEEEEEEEQVDETPMRPTTRQHLESVELCERLLMTGAPTAAAAAAVAPHFSSSRLFSIFLCGRTTTHSRHSRQRERRNDFKFWRHCHRLSFKFKYSSFFFSFHFIII